MDKFWAWMNEKGYASGCWLIRPSKFGFRTQEIKEPTKQMLIGYMIEYLGVNTVDNLYENLIKDIEENKKYSV